MYYSKRVFMRHLVSRFIKQPENNPPDHFFDPYLDLRKRFKELEKLEKSVEARKLNLNVKDIHKNYNLWWEKFAELNKVDKKEKETKSKLKNELYGLSHGIVDALRLPNNLDFPSTSTFEYTSNFIPTSIPNEKDSMKFLNQNSEHVSKTREIKRQLEDFLKTSNVVRISPPMMVRLHMMEACNIEMERFPLFTEGGDHPTMCLTGISLPSMLATFLMETFSVSKQGNGLPLTLFSSGATYFTPKYRPSVPYPIDRQHESICVLFLTQTDEDCHKISQELGDRVLEKIRGLVNQSLEYSPIPPPILRLYESSALAAKTKNGWDVIRIGFANTYLSERCVITYEIKENRDRPNFVNLACLEIDLDVLTLSLLNC